MTTTGGSTRRGAPQWMKLLLILSLAVNLAVVGIFAGYRFARSEPEPERERGPDHIVDRIIRMVPEERRALAEERFAGARQRLLDAAGQRDADLAGVLAALRADPYDPAAVESAFRTMSDHWDDRRSIVLAEMVTMLAELTPAERAYFADRMEERFNRD